MPAVIRDRDRLARTAAHDAALSAIEAGIEAADPATAVGERVTIDGDRLAVGGTSYDLGRYDEILVLGGGKAAGPIAVALTELLGDRLAGGAIVVPEPVEADPVEVYVGGHPLPDEGSVEGARRVLELAEAADERTLVLAVVTGGGSALLAAPSPGISLDDLQGVTEALLAAGVDIGGINAVRKHCSAIKGGGLARAAAPATVVGLLVSDVVGDDAGVIASGPTAADPTTFGEAVTVLERANVEPPASIAAHLSAGARGDREETPTVGDATLAGVENHVLVNAWTALSAASATLEERGYPPCVLSSRMRGEARESALAHVAIAEEVAATGSPVEPPAGLCSGGELTVTVRGEGRGGPNLEFALRGAMELPAGAVLASVDTDGRDGSTDAAGAVVDAETVVDPAVAREALDANDAYGYLADREALLETGATGTNVNDLRLVVVPDPT